MKIIYNQFLLLFFLVLINCTKKTIKNENIDLISLQGKSFLIQMIEKNQFNDITNILDQKLLATKNYIINHAHFDNDGNGLLHYSTLHDDIKILIYLIKQGSNLNSQNKYKNTPLHLSILAENINAVKVLLEKNADMEIKNKQGYTPFQMALKKKNNEIIKLFVEKKYGHELAQAKKGNKEPLQLAISQYSERRKVKIMKFLKYNKYI